MCQPNIKLVVLNKPAKSEDEKYQKFLNELQSYGCGYWKWSLKRRIREVFVVDDIKNPETGNIDKICIRRKTIDFVQLEDSRRFDIMTGRCLYGEPKYIFPVENRQVWGAWEPQSLRQRVERALPSLRLEDVQAYAYVLSTGQPPVSNEGHPYWHLGIVTEIIYRAHGRNFDRPASSLSEREEASMASCRKCAKKSILDHLPGAIQQFRALVEMMEGDAK
jgi:hypothetical protein